MRDPRDAKTCDQCGYDLPPYPARYVAGSRVLCESCCFGPCIFREVRSTDSTLD